MTLAQTQREKVTISGVTYEIETLEDGSKAVLERAGGLMFRNVSERVIHQGMTLPELLERFDQTGAIVIIARKV